MDRRTFSTLLAGTVAVPGLSSSLSWGQARTGKSALYSGVGTAFTQYEVDVDAATLARRATVNLPGGVQYAWPHPARPILYISSSSGGPGQSGNEHHITAFRMDAAGILQQHGAPLRLRWRPIHNSVDRAGEYLLIAYNNPSAVSVHRINPDGSIGDEVAQPEKLDVGIYGHQILSTPSNQSLILIARGNNAAGGKPEDPGSIKVFGFKNGLLTNKASVQPGTGLGFGPRHLDFHPTRPWVYVSVERQNKLSAYALLPDGGLSPDPLFVKDTVLDPSRHVSSAGPIHVHPNGRFVYVTNRHGWTGSPPPGHEVFEGKRVFTTNESTVAVFAIDQQSGEPRLIQAVDSHGAHPRTFAIDPSGRMLVAGSLVPIAVREGGKLNVLPAGLSVFRIGQDGKLEFARKYEIDTKGLTQWWSGMVALG